jgi:ClpP class serine protease
MANQLESLNKTLMGMLLNQLEQKLNADVFVYYGEIINGVERDVKDIIENLSKDANKHEKIYVILTTPGGSLPPVQRMVDILRHFYTEVNFIVPDYAYSAGTIWCMSGDNIYMNYFSTLGPIDPQVQNKDGKLVAALGYLDKINELLEKAKSDELTKAEFIILKDFDLAEIRSYEQAKELAVDMLKIWLTKYKFKDWIKHRDGTEVTAEQKEARAIEIANKLSDNNIWRSHGRPIGIQTLREELHLKIVDFGEDAELSDLISKYYDGMIEYIRKHNYKMFLQTRLFI